MRRQRRTVDEVLADLDPEVLESLDLEALGIERDAADGFGAQTVPLGANCGLVQRADNAATRQMTARQFIRCRRGSASKDRAQALLDALRQQVELMKKKHTNCCEHSSFTLYPRESLTIIDSRCGLPQRTHTMLLLQMQICHEHDLKYEVRTT